MSEDYFESPRRITRSMTMKTGSVVCEEVKLSALLKATQLCDKIITEEEDARKIKDHEEKTKSRNSLNFSASPSKFDETDANLSKQHFSDSNCLDSVKRRQLEELEQERKRDVEEVVSNKAAQFRAHSLMIRADLEKRARQREIERKEEEAAIKAEIEEIDNTERNRTSLVLQLQNKLNDEHEKKVEKIIEEAGKIDMMKREEQKLKNELLEKIGASNIKFRETYQQISKALHTFPYREELVQEVSIAQDVMSIKNLFGMMDTLCKQCKVGEVSNLDVTTSESLTQRLEVGFSTVKAKLDAIISSKEKANQELEEKKEVLAPAAENSPLKPAAEQQPVATISNVEVAPTLSANVTGLEGFISKENLEELTRLQTLLEEYLSSLKPFELDQSLKKYRFQLQMSINTPLNAISAVNASHLKDKLQRLRAVLRGQVVEVGNNNVSASSHPNGVAYCTNLLAERIVDQGEQIVSSKPESAFPVAAVALALWAEFPQFGELLLAHFYSKCPFLVPYYAPRSSDTTDRDYYTSLGYKYDLENKIESQDKYLKRMMGTAQLFFAIMTSTLPRDVSAPIPLTTARVWRWMASILNLDPRPDISATILLACMEVAGYPMYCAYKKQLIKLVFIIANEYFNLIKQVSPNVASGPISRLEIYLTKIVNGFMFSPPPGTLPHNFW